MGDRETYRTKDEVERWRAESDPVLRLRRSIVDAALLAQAALEEIDAEVAAQVAAAVEFAESSPYPDPATLLDNVTGIDIKIRGNL